MGKYKLSNGPKRFENIKQVRPRLLSKAFIYYKIFYQMLFYRSVLTILMHCAINVFYCLYNLKLNRESFLRLLKSLRRFGFLYFMISYYVCINSLMARVFYVPIVLSLCGLYCIGYEYPLLYFVSILVYGCFVRLFIMKFDTNFEQEQYNYYGHDLVAKLVGNSFLRDVIIKTFISLGIAGVDTYGAVSAINYIEDYRIQRLKEVDASIWVDLKKHFFDIKGANHKPTVEDWVVMSKEHSERLRIYAESHKTTVNLSELRKANINLFPSSSLWPKE